ncbi:MAG: hypothetical protein KIS66_08100 [Fimbriimonadaceae bacterium]|nr:hypothetical protein [Fimbriimonadaceae bacterium]
MSHQNGNGRPIDPDDAFDPDALAELDVLDDFDDLDDADDLSFEETEALRFVYSPNVRDHFASVALAAILDTNRQSLNLREAKRHAGEWAEIAFAIADAMLARRRPPVDFPEGDDALWDEPLAASD